MPIDPRHPSLLKPALGVGLENPGEAQQMVLGMLAAAIWQVNEPASKKALR